MPQRDLTARYQTAARGRGLDIRRLSEYHLRINGLLDFWPSTGRWHRLDTKARGDVYSAAELARVLDNLPVRPQPERDTPPQPSLFPPLAVRLRNMRFRLHDGSIIDGSQLTLMDIMRGARLEN